ncbi:hypothetical protein [Pricia sp.]|uniref:hypothetical protein n=1 Tax=Pricia sp. TaxID=2268138 RepID=UPI0035934CA3
MELTVFWTEFAKGKLDQIFEYYKRKSRSANVARKLVDGIIDHTIGLEINHISERGRIFY